MLDITLKKLYLVEATLEHFLGHGSVSSRSNILRLVWAKDRDEVEDKMYGEYSRSGWDGSETILTINNISEAL
jgi:hypothetical protein